MTVWPFMRYKWWFLGILSAVTVFAIIAVFAVGLEFGIDFRGGVRMSVALEQNASVDDVRTIADDAGVNEPIVQSVVAAGSISSFLITAQEMDKAQQDAIVAELESRFGVTEGTTSVETVGASFGNETTRRALLAVAIAIVGIIAYLSFRFEFKFAIPAIVALIHDVAFTLGIYAIGHRLVTTATVAAILTILGYSVHDTIIVYDRMRENTQLMKKEDTYGDMVDLSIRQTMIRSINTTVALLLPLLAILIFGGPTLKDFALALTIGTVAGAWSSFFVAAPLVVLWKEREPRYKKRLLAAAAGAGGGTVDVEGPATAATKTVVPDAGNGSSGDSGAKPASARVSRKPRKGKTSKRPVAKQKKRTSR